MVKRSFKQKTGLIIFGLFLAFVVLEISLRISGAILLSLQEHANRLAIKQKGTYRIMCLGESTTQGQYPAILEKILNKNNAGIQFSVIDKGIIGTMICDVLEQLEPNLDRYQPDMVITMLGINDVPGRIPYRQSLLSNSLFKSFKTYKLASLIWLHIVTRVSGKQEDSFRDKLCFSGIKLEAPTSQQKAKVIDPKIEQGWLYFRQGRLPEAETAFRGAVAANPQSSEARLNLGWFYQKTNRFSEAKEAFFKAVELDPSNNDAYLELGTEEAMLKAIELNAKNDTAYTYLGWYYDQKGELIQAEKAFKKAIELDPGNEKKWATISVFYETAGKKELARKYAKKVDRFRAKHYNPIVAYGYLKIKDVLAKRGIRLVCMQYPMRDIGPLKKIFEGDAEGIVFIENKDVFFDAVTQRTLREYFKDMFAGDFGHCTPEGNRLLAENAAKTILKEVVNH